MLPFDEPLVLDGISYPTVENFYQAMKKANQETRRMIAAAPPGKAKRLGKKVTLRPGWALIRLIVMEYALRHKFAPGTTWHTKLMATGNEEIVEWNNWGDRFWGKDISDRQGRNVLGTLLVALRHEYRITTETDADMQSARILAKWKGWHSQ